MFKIERKKGLAVLVSMMILMFIATTGCNGITTIDETQETNSRLGVKIVKEINEASGDVTWLITLDKEQSENGLPYYEKLITDFVADHSDKDTVELKELSIFIIENIGEYDVIDEYRKTRGKSVAVLVPTKDGRVEVVIVNI